MFWAEPPNRSRVNGLFVLLLCAINFSTLQAERLPVKTYIAADGSGREQVNQIVQDSHGFLWFRTAERLSRFAGHKSANSTTADGLAGHAVSDLLETRDGSYLVAISSLRFLTSSIGWPGKISRPPLAWINPWGES